MNLREQHDAFEFFNCLVDSLDEGLKAYGSLSALSRVLGGSFADQKICKGCPHRYVILLDFLIFEVFVPYLELDTLEKNPSQHWMWTFVTNNICTSHWMPLSKEICLREQMLTTVKNVTKRYIVCMYNTRFSAAVLMYGLSLLYRLTQWRECVSKSFQKFLLSNSRDLIMTGKGVCVGYVCGVHERVLLLRLIIIVEKWL